MVVMVTDEGSATNVESTCEPLIGRGPGADLRAGLHPEREPLFYSRFRNNLDITAPRGYYGAYDDRAWRSIAIMENIASTRGAQFLSPLQPSDRGGMEDLLADLATMHGRFWAHPEIAVNGLR